MRLAQEGRGARASLGLLHELAEYRWDDIESCPHAISSVPVNGCRASSADSLHA